MPNNDKLQYYQNKNKLYLYVFKFQKKGKKIFPHTLLSFFQQLGRVMEGWKKRDEEKEEMLGKAEAEKHEIEQKMQEQQQVCL